MNIIQKIKNSLYPESSLSTPEKWVAEMFGSGSKITQDTALEVTACYACVRVLSEQIAIIPLNVYKNDKEKGRIKMPDLNLHKILNLEPNPYMTAYNFWRAIMFNYLLTGFGYAEIERDPKTREPKALWPIPTSRVKKGINKKGEPVYEVTVDDQNGGKSKRKIAYSNMLEIQGLTPDGYSVYEPLELLKNALGLSRSAELYSKEFFEEGTHPSGVIEYNNTLRGEKLESFKKSVKDAYSGLGKHHRVMLLEDGMKFNRITAPPNEGQMFESRKFQVIEVARFFNVPPHKIMELDRATYNNIEEINIQWVGDSLLPILTNIKQAVYQSMLFNFQKEDEHLYVEHDLNNLLRGRMEDRYNAYKSGRQWGWLSVNEIRKAENMNDIGPQGDLYIVPLNMREAGKGGNE